jgi:nucleotide-binding universal stress UspA family protein
MTASHPRIVVGIDPTPAHEAVSLAGALAVLTGGELLLGAVYGHESGTFGGLTWPSRDEADGWLKEAESRLAGSGFPWNSYTVPADSAAQGLVVLAERESAAMIVLGSSHRGTVGRVFAGSTVRRVLHGAPCAVAVAPHRWQPLAPDASVSIGVALGDAAHESREALAMAARLAGAAHAPLQVLTVVDQPSPAHPMFAATGTSYEHWLAEARRAAERHAHEALAAVAPDADAAVRVLDGHAVERLAEASHGLDLLVLGSRRYGPVRTTLLGGVSSPLIDRAGCPLVIVPRGVAGDAAAHPAEPVAAHA